MLFICNNHEVHENHVAFSVAIATYKACLSKISNKDASETLPISTRFYPLGKVDFRILGLISSELWLLWKRWVGGASLAHDWKNHVRALESTFMKLISIIISIINGQ